MIQHVHVFVFVRQCMIIVLVWIIYCKAIYVTSHNSYLNYHPLSLCLQEYKRKQLEEQKQAERLQRQLHQERAFLVSLQQQQQDSRPSEKKQLYHYKDAINPSDKPNWAKEVGKLEIRLNLSFFQHRSTVLLQGWCDLRNKFFNANLIFCPNQLWPWQATSTSELHTL